MLLQLYAMLYTFTNVLSSVQCRFHTGITLSETKLFKTVYIAYTLLFIIINFRYLVKTHDSEFGRAHSSEIGRIRFHAVPATS